MGSEPEEDSEPDRSVPRWGHNPEPFDDSHSIQGKLLWLLVMGTVGGLAAAVRTWSGGPSGPAWGVAVLAAVGTAAATALFCRWERLPILPGLLPGSLMGLGSYAATSAYLAGRTTVYLLELPIPSIVGSVPGIVLFLVVMRVVASKHP